MEGLVKPNTCIPFTKQKLDESLASVFNKEDDAEHAGKCRVTCGNDGAEMYHNGN